MQRLVYLVSDLHMGQGRDAPTHEWNALEDFKVDDAFCAFVDHITDTDEPVELIIAGDFIEYLQILPDFGLLAEEDHYGTTEKQSLERTYVALGQRPDVASGHPEVFARLRGFLADGHSLTILAGNHDIDLLWSSVWATIANEICPSPSHGKLRLQSFSHIVGTGDHGRVYIEHGQEHDRANAFGNQMSDPFLYDDRNVRRLKRCWGTLFVDKVYNQLEKEQWFIDSVKPITRIIKLGLRGNFFFTASAMALLAKFFIVKGPPAAPDWNMSFQTGTPLPHKPSQKLSVEDVINVVDDNELRAYLGHYLEDPSFRNDFEQEINRLSTAGHQTMRNMQADTKDIVWTKNGEAMTSFFLGFGEKEESPYRSAARAVLTKHPAVSTVIMGHTHQPINGHDDPIELEDGRLGYYFNSGTWTPRLREDDSTHYEWEDLKNPDNYTSSLDYVRMEPDSDGSYHVTLRSWQE